MWNAWNSTPLTHSQKPLIQKQIMGRVPKFKQLEYAITITVEVRAAYHEVYEQHQLLALLQYGT